MSNEEFETSMSIPLDSDGFVRRQCPTCERELKWFVNQDVDAEETPEPEGGFYCPYCAVQAPGGEWHTQAQVELANSIILQQFVEPQLADFSRNVQRLNKPGGLISFEVKHDNAEPADPLTETDDMKRVDFPCHPEASTKVLDEWTREVHCSICGAAVELS